MEKIFVVNDVINYFTVINRTIFYVGKDYSLYMSTGTEGQLVMKGDFNSVYKVADEIWAFDEGTMKTKVFKLADSSTEILEHVFSPVLEYDDAQTDVFCLARDKNSFFYCWVDVHSKQIARKYNFNNNCNEVYVPDRSTWLCRQDQSLFCYSLEHTNQKWCLSFKELLGSDEVALQGKILRHRNKLYFFLSHNTATRPKATFCIDEETGKVIHRFDDITGDLFVCNEKIYAVGMHDVYIIDPTSATASEIDLKDILEPHSLSINYGRSILTQDGLLYFVDGWGMPSHRLGLLDLNGRKLLWDGSIEDNSSNNTSVRNIQLHGNRLYAHASDNRLHVFEK